MKNLVLLLTAALPLSFAPQSAPKPVFFPLSENSSWEYSGNAKIAGNPTSLPMRMRMDVIEVIERNGVRAAWVRGNPMTLADDKQGSGDQVLSRVGTRMYLTSSAREGEIRARMVDPADKLSDLFKEADFLVDIAMPVGPGASLVGKDYRIVRKVKGGSQTISFRPGIGISEFRYTAGGDSGVMKLDSSDVQPESALP